MNPIYFPWTSVASPDIPQKNSHQVHHVHHWQSALHERKSAEYLLVQCLVAEGNALACIAFYPGLPIKFPLDGCVVMAGGRGLN
jgi:hypothetical protein